MNKYTLEQWRKLKGFSQEELARKTGLSARTIINYEKKHTLPKASYQNVQKIANALDIKLSQFIL
ncbi:MAG: helix-turn-helix transcriptional regulator [Lactobacillus crispatus]|nr:helix-turn-helix transcriptional regulator [Lactobacillus crispatus]MCT7757269.1 helix-turn-helix transcriptional regulator [Lactobacillus iners]MCT7822740.1 helix-turn-helix transcriptional regulator [Lactobacillus crispatus]